MPAKIIPATVRQSMHVLLPFCNGLFVQNSIFCSLGCMDCCANTNVLTCLLTAVNSKYTAGVNIEDDNKYSSDATKFRRFYQPERKDFTAISLTKFTAWGLWIAVLPADRHCSWADCYIVQCSSNV